MAKNFKKREIEYHPILLKESQGHYHIDKDQPNTIIEFEQENSIENAFGAISYNLLKYKNRQKEQTALDLKKIETFEWWRELLKDLLELGYPRETNLRYAMKVEYPDMKYSLDVA